MTLRIRDVQIENVNRYPETVVGGLREALENGAPVVPDPRRVNFYEVHAAGRNYYIDVLPESHRVVLLGAWPSYN